jgi:glutathione S-transferase
MHELTANPAFGVYAIMSAVLSLNMLALWGYSGGVRGGTKTTMNPEDAATFAKGAAVVSADPDAVARVMRAHLNATANIVPFLFLGLLYVMLGASAKMAWILFGSFTVLRLGHSLAYLGGKQPWRTICFAVGGLVTLVLVEEVVRASVGLL